MAEDSRHWIPGAAQETALTGTPLVSEPGGVEFGRTYLGFELDAKQALILESGAKRGILNCSRHWGKSTVAAIQAVHRAWSRPRSLVMVASPGERQSAEFLRKTAEMLQKLGIAARGDG